MNSSFTRSSRFGVPIWHAMPHMEFGHVRQTEQNPQPLQLQLGFESIYLSTCIINSNGFTRSSGFGILFSMPCLGNMNIWPWQKLLTILEHVGQTSGCGQPLLPQLLQTLVRLGSGEYIVPELVQKTHVAWQCWKLKVSRGRRWNTDTELSNAIKH